MNLYWTITETCQLKCRYCYYEVGTCKRHKENIDLDLFKSRISEISKHVETITFTGGEVLLLPYFWEIVEAARKHNIKVNFLTDGIRFDEKNLEKALSLSVSSVSISLDSLENEVNEFQRPLKRNKTNSLITEIIINNIINASQHICDDFSLTINQSVTRLNIHSIKPMADFARKHNIRHLVHLVGIPEEAGLVNMRMENSLLDERIILEDQMKYWAKGNQGFEDYFDIVFFFLGKPLSFSITCPMMKETINANAKGDLYSCFYRTEGALGNIFTSDISKVLTLKQPFEIKEGLCAKMDCACMIERYET